ncbi:uncharacterized protein LOC109822199 isoform X3 [Asparagus officinalis]|nr:uncharacterized protein LOC109822199 isoform X3 [Asparagus officinalis]
MGKREYKSMGQSDCSIPVASIRENLIVAIHDPEGNEIFHTEFRTMSVVEKGILEDSYPLKSGGRINMKLQFSLNSEEQMRIRKMRESALKRKGADELQNGAKGSALGQKTGNWITYSTTEGALLDQSQQTDPDSSGSSSVTSSQVSEQPSESSYKRDDGQLVEVKKESVKIQSPVDVVNKWKVFSKFGLKPQFETTRSLVSENATDQHSYSDSTELRENKKRSNVRKMVTVFESSLFQEQYPRYRRRTKPSQLNMGIEGSLKRVSSEESDIDKLKARPRRISKSFSSSMLSDIELQQNPKFIQSAFLKKEEELEHVGPNNDEKIRSQDSFERKPVKETVHSRKAVNSVKFTDHVEEGKDIKINDVQTVIKSVAENLQLPQIEKVEAVNTKVKENKECAPLQETQFSESRSDEEIEALVPNGTVNSFKHFYVDGCHFGNSDLWTTRRLCITTGNRQLRDLLDYCTTSGGMNQIEDNPSLGSATKFILYTAGVQQKPDDDALTEASQNERSSYRRVEEKNENSIGIAKFSAGLIEQVAPCFMKSSSGLWMNTYFVHAFSVHVEMYLI